MNNGTMLRTCTVAATVTACAVALSGAGPASAAVTYETRGLTGDPAPGTGPGVVFNFFSNIDPVINGLGQIAFIGDLTGTGVDGTNDRGIWSEGSGSLSLVARTSYAAPGTTPDVMHGILFDPVINSAGQIAFSSSFSDPVNATFGQGLWVGGIGSLSLIARAGDAAPGTDPGVTYDFFGDPVINSAGQIAFRGDLTGTGVDATNDRGIWVGGVGSLSLIARTGDAAPGTDPGVVYSRLDVSSPMLNGAGQTAFSGRLTGTGVDFTNSTGIWSGGSGSLSMVARQGEVAPGTGPGVVYSGFGFDSDPVLNGAGQTAFRSNLTGTGVDSSNDEGIWLESSGSLGLVVREGDAAPGMGPGVVFGNSFFSDNFSNPVLNGAGQTAFNGSLNGTGVDTTNNASIWLGGTGSLSMIVREGDAAPGTDPGVVFSGFSDLMLNSAGQTAFRADLTGTGVDGTNNTGIWAGSMGSLSLVLREGDLFDINDDPLIDDLHRILAISLVTSSGGEDGRATSFNDAGQLAFNLLFTNFNTGIFVANIGLPVLPGDLNDDGFVGVDDLNIVLLNWNQNVTAGVWLGGDATGDGFVGVDDLNIVLVNWNNGTPPADGANIPEPGAVTLLVVGGLALLRRRCDR